MSIAHREIRCYTVPGAGESYILGMEIEEQASVVATTSYGLPEITSMVGPGVEFGHGDGNQSVDIVGVNFGPFGNKQFFQSVTYGETGVEYIANCVHQSHTFIKCLTAPGSGAQLLWKVTISGQSNLLSTAGQTSYGPPNVTGVIPVAIRTNGVQPMQLVGSNFGISDSSYVPVKTFVDIQLGGNTVRRSLDYTLTPTGLKQTYVQEYGVHVIAFEAPSLECNACSSTFLVKVVTQSDSGAQFISNWFPVPFQHHNFYT